MTDRYFIHRSKSGTRHIANDQDESLCGQKIVVNALAVGAHTRKDLDDLAALVSCGTCRRRWAEYESRPLAVRDHSY